jgi:BirA family transcriptional regulator, biotin operon repressor / biotin---[acetyl-CoA-carboxylase] ligase
MTFSLGPRARSAGFQFAAFDQVGSTNAMAMFVARRGPMWFASPKQTAEYGRHHRRCLAPRVSLVACSIIEAMEGAPAVAATPGFAARHAFGGLQQRVSIEVSLRATGSDHMKFSMRMPNDVLVGHRMLADILIETEVVADDRLVASAGAA